MSTDIFYVAVDARNMLLSIILLQVAYLLRFCFRFKVWGKGS